LRWLQSGEKDLKNTGLRNWRSKSQDREEWRTIFKEAKVHQGLYCRKKKKKKKEEEEEEEGGRQRAGGDRGKGELGGGGAGGGDKEEGVTYVVNVSCNK
jgi:hypothetical protein